MEMNFQLLPLMLVLLCLTGLGVFCIDWWLMRKPRAEALLSLKAQCPNYNVRGSGDYTAYREGIKAWHAGRPWWIRETRSLLPVLWVVLLLRSFVAEPFQIPSASMEPTLKTGDFILVNKFTYGLRLPVLRNKILSIGSPERSDVVVFFPPNEQRYFIKRVIGTPGDVVAYRNKRLTVNGNVYKQALLSEQMSQGFRYQHREERLGNGVTYNVGVMPDVYVRKNTFGYTNSNDRFIVTVPPGHYFVMGDNRDRSSDSRMFGMVAEERLVGKAFFIWMHWPSWGQLPRFDRVGSF